MKDEKAEGLATLRNMSRCVEQMKAKDDDSLQCMKAWELNKKN